MNAIKNAVFFVGLGLWFTHELDAMRNHEWRVLPVLRDFADETGASVFLLAHVPIFAVTVALIASSNARLRARSQTAISIFLVVHGLLHTLYSGHVDYKFSSSGSISLIYGAAALGLIRVLTDLRRQTE